ncbi:calcium/proton exchanger [Paraburkholderia sp. MMS20-SJTN17]|uniref:Ca(2+)/H(+) antiporter n=1 Tax=Paraburkholderia translucens TaxID=2886945 RepID=A0ABS8K742_9BURK|nr:calcium/proton exchanger [Paraburkholderia sp. MMS20-SJTN17]MCC8400539.1 calcium/proton exchanger [Paraburkholderia sp. MMS20-SJTN17]
MKLGAQKEKWEESMWMSWLLVFVPIAVALEFFASHQYLLIFVASSLAILPLAGWMGHATEQLADRMGEGVGGLLNATFGNAAELIIAFVALHAGLHQVVEASIIGSVVGNMLLVLGAAMLAGGIRYPEQRFNPLGARSQATMLMLAAVALILPAAFQEAEGATAAMVHRLSVSFCVVLLLIYALYLMFSLVTHPGQFRSSATTENDAPAQHEGNAPQPLWRSLTILAAATAGTAWISEIMVGSIEPMVHQFGFSGVFVGAFVVAILGNAAEHATAITAALNNRLDLSFSISLGSSVQVALFVAPVLILASHFVGQAPMDLAFRPDLVLIVVMSGLVTAQVAGDGRSDWFKGVQLLVVYFAMALTFFFLPA